MLNSSLCNYSDVYVLVKGTITVIRQGANDGVIAAGRNNKKLRKNWAPFTDRISKINNTQIDNGKDLDIVIAMYNLIEHSDNYAKTSGSLWKYCKNEPNDNLNLN